MFKLIILDYSKGVLGFWGQVASEVADVLLCVCYVLNDWFVPKAESYDHVRWLKVSLRLLSRVVL